MNRLLMEKRKKRKEKKTKEKKNCTDAHFGISTEQHIRVEFYEKYKKREEKEKRHENSKSLKRYPYLLIPR